MKFLAQIWIKLKKRWGISNNLQVLVILMVFALSGFSTLFSHRYIDLLLGITDATPIWIEILVFVVLILPVFNIFLLLWGTLLGQRKFVVKFIHDKIQLITKWKIDND